MRISDWSSDVCSSDLAVVVNRGEFEIHRIRFALHRCAQLALHLRRFAREKILRVPGQFRIIRFTDPSDTGSRAALDLIEQAGPRAIGARAIGTASEEKKFLQRVPGTTH